MIKKPSSSTAGFESSDKPLAFFSPDVLGDYELELEVSDGKQTSTDKILVSSNNIRPKAQAGVDELVNTGDEVQLDGTASSDTKGTSLNYSWSFIKKPIGSVAEIKSRRAKRPRFTVDKAGDYEIELELSDGLLSNKNRVLISTLNIPPQVEIAKPSLPSIDKALSLSSAITDEDVNNTGDDERKISYKWSVLSAPVGDSSYSFSNPNSKDTSFTALRPGDYVLQLIADDEEFYGVDTVLLSYGNQAPVAKTGRNIPNAITNKKVDLNGSGSTDPEGKALSYEWSFDLKPQGSMAVIGDAKKQQAFFMPDKTGVYRVALTVSDGFLSSKDVIKVTVKEPKNQAPTLAKIGNKSVKIGEELSFKLMGSDKDNGDIIRYTVSPFPLYENMRFNTKTGEFYFKPRGHQAGEYNLKFTVIDNLGAEKSRNVKITVNALKKKGKTSVKGRVLEANAMANSQTELALAGVDVRLSVDGNNMYMSMTDNEGYFTINDIPKGEEYIIQIATSGITLNGKPKYGDFHEQIEVIEKAENVITRPFYMPLVDTNGVAEITANKATKLVNTAIKAELDVPANVSRMNGMAYTGDISLSEVPKALAPIALPESLRGTATLLTLQPAGLRFTTPVRVTFPNRNNYPAGTELDIYSVNPDTGLFEISGKGRVNADRSKIETISGGITAATWHTDSPPPPPPECEDEICMDEDDEDCETCETGSRVDLMTGVLREEHTLASYRSLNEERVLTLGYNSKSAKPYKQIVSMKRFYPVVSSIPGTVSAQIRILGSGLGKEVVSDSSILSENEVQPFVLRNSIELPISKTGIYPIEQITTSNYSASRFSSIVRKDISVVDYTKSPYGKGWAVVNLHRIYKNPQGHVLLVRGNSYKAQFRAPKEEKEESFFQVFALPSVGQNADSLQSEPITYSSPNGDYSTLERVSNGSYVRRMKDGMIYKFNSEGLLMSEEDRNGNKTSYCYYNNTDRLKCIKDPNGMEYTFSYGNDNMLDSITDPQGRVTSFEHDSNGNLIKITDPDNTTREFSYSEEGLLLAQRDKRGNLSNYVYNERDQVIQTIKQDGTGVDLQAQGSLGLPEGDDEGTMEEPLSLVKVEEDKGMYKDANGNISYYTLNERGQFTNTIDALGRETDIERDKDGNRTQLMTPREFVWDYSYDEMGNQTMIRQNETANTTFYTYEPNFNQISSLAAPNGDMTRYEYDDNGNMIKLILPDNTFYTFKHNRAGLMEESIDPEGNKTQYFYDRVTGNLIAIRDSLGNTTTFKLDTAGNIIQAKDAKGNLIKSEYDSLNRLVKNTDAEGGESLYTYDPKGNLMSLTDERGNITSYVYDVLDRLIQRTNPLNQREYFSYNNEGYMTSHLNRLGELTTYNYDKANQLVRRKIVNENTYNYSYDLDGNLITLEDNDSKLTYSYDALDRIISASTGNSPKQPPIAQLYEYDKNSNRIGLRAGLEREDISRYFTNIYTYDLENQLTRLDSPAGAFDFKYDDLSRMTGMTYPNGMRTEMSYEGDTRLSKVEHIKQGIFEKTQSLFKYDYDYNDNKTRMKTFRRALPTNETLNYTYDKKDQLLTATNPLRGLADESFIYDIAGNLLRKQGQSQDSAYNENNQLTDDGTYTYKYDSKGNMTEKTHKTNKQVTRYHWDIENQLIKVTTHENETALPSKTITYAYDALGRRIEKNINGKSKRYVYDNEDILMEFDEENAFQKYYVHGLGIDDPLAMLKDNEETRNDPMDFKTYYYHKDAMNSITSLTDEQANEKEKYIYNAFGKMTIYDERDKKIEESQIGNPYSFTGREHDSETGLHYHRARYYSPELARWISEDPIEFNSGDMNLYRYVGNNPASLVDSYGERISTPQGLAIYAVYALTCNAIKKVRLVTTVNKILSEERKKILKKIKKLEKELEICTDDDEEKKIELEILELKSKTLIELKSQIKQAVKDSLVDHFVIDTICSLSP